VRVLFIPEVGHEEPFLADLTSALPGSVELLEFVYVDSLSDQFVGVSVFVDQGGYATREMINAAAENNTKLWQIVSTGIDHCDVGYAVSKGIAVANTPGQCSAVALAEHALLLMLYVARRIPEARWNLESGLLYEPVGTELFTKTLGIIGLGASGRALAARASGLGMRVVAFDSEELDTDSLSQIGIERFSANKDSLEDLLSEADYVSLHVPLTPTTARMIDAYSLSRMKPTAVLINVARGGLVDENALAEALGAGRLRGAGIDVRCREADASDGPLFSLPNVFATPHIAGSTEETSARRAAVCSENIRRVLMDRDPLYLVGAPA
jgi:D-3-phosphoglycerate dehydrogenase